MPRRLPQVLQVWEGEGVVKSARKLIGATNPLEAEPGTIRGDFAVQASGGWLGAGFWAAGFGQRVKVDSTQRARARASMPVPVPLCLQVGRNVVHGSDSTENGERETGPPLAGVGGPAFNTTNSWLD